MKRMVYVIVCLSILIVVSATAFGLVGCNSNTEEPELVGMSLSQNHMNYSECYSFYLRQEDDKVLFDAQLNLYEEPYSIVLEGVEVDKANFEKLVKLENKYEIVKYVLNYRKKKLPIQVMDETVNTTSVYFQDNTDKSADTSGNYEQDLYEFFRDLTLEYKAFSVASSDN